MFTLRQLLLTMADSSGLTRTLGEIDLCRDAQDRPCYSAGNSAVVFRIRHLGHIRSLRCYLRPMRHLREIYGDRLREKELYIYSTPESGTWTDVVLGDWIEGVTLHEAITKAALAHNTTQLAHLAAAFDSLAAELIADDYAHGDLKPENILVDTDGCLQLIDFDATFLPVFAGEQSPELGTAAYQHPARTAVDFDASLDDYPAALISTALHALALDPLLYERHCDTDGLLFTPQKIRTDPALREVLTLFESEGCARQYRIAEQLLSPTLRLFGLAALLTPAQPDESDTRTPELFVENGRWGYRTSDRVVVKAVYDCGFDFTEGLAAVLLHRTWLFIDTQGRTVIRCTECEAVKPFCNGRAQVICNNRRYQIDTAGHKFGI